MSHPSDGSIDYQLDGLSGIPNTTAYGEQSISSMPARGHGSSKPSRLVAPVCRNEASTSVSGEQQSIQDASTVPYSRGSQGMYSDPRTDLQQMRPAYNAPSEVALFTLDSLHPPSLPPGSQSPALRFAGCEAQITLQRSECSFPRFPYVMDSHTFPPVSTATLPYSGWTIQEYQSVERPPSYQVESSGANLPMASSSQIPSGGQSSSGLEASKVSGVKHSRTAKRRRSLARHPYSVERYPRRARRTQTSAEWDPPTAPAGPSTVMSEGSQIIGLGPEAPLPITAHVAQSGILTAQCEIARRRPDARSHCSFPSPSEMKAPLGLTNPITSITFLCGEHFTRFARRDKTRLRPNKAWVSNVDGELRRAYILCDCTKGTHKGPHACATAQVQDGKAWCGNTNWIPRG